MPKAQTHHYRRGNIEEPIKSIVREHNKRVARDKAILEDERRAASQKDKKKILDVLDKSDNSIYKNENLVAKERQQTKPKHDRHGAIPKKVKPKYKHPKIQDAEEAARELQNSLQLKELFEFHVCNTGKQELIDSLLLQVELFNSFPQNPKLETRLNAVLFVHLKMYSVFLALERMFHINEIAYERQIATYSGLFQIGKKKIFNFASKIPLVSLERKIDQDKIFIQLRNQIIDKFNSNGIKILKEPNYLDGIEIINIEKLREYTLSILLNKPQDLKLSKQLIIIKPGNLNIEKMQCIFANLFYTGYIVFKLDFYQLFHSEFKLRSIEEQVILQISCFNQLSEDGKSTILGFLENNEISEEFKDQILLSEGFQNLPKQLQEKIQQVLKVSTEMITPIVENRLQVRSLAYGQIPE